MRDVFYTVLPEKSSIMEELNQSTVAKTRKTMSDRSFHSNEDEGLVQLKPAIPLVIETALIF